VVSGAMAAAILTAENDHPLDLVGRSGATANLPQAWLSAPGTFVGVGTGASSSVGPGYEPADDLAAATPGKPSAQAAA